MPDLSRPEYEARTEEVIDAFQLRGCADTLVGDPVGKLKGLSG